MEVRKDPLAEEILKATRFYLVNKKVIKHFGLGVGMYLELLQVIEAYVEKRDGWFEMQPRTVVELLDMPIISQWQCDEELEKAGILEKEYVIRHDTGVYFCKLNHEKIREIEEEE